jgi:hypothetical protein
MHVGLDGQQERGADPSAGGARRQHGGQGRGCRYPARRKHGPVGETERDLQDQQRRHVAGVTAGLGSLRDEYVDARAQRNLGVRARLHLGRDQNAVRVKFADIRRRIDERDRNEVRALLDRRVEQLRLALESPAKETDAEFARRVSGSGTPAVQFDVGCRPCFVDADHPEAAGLGDSPGQ